MLYDKKMTSLKDKILKGSEALGKAEKPKKVVETSRKVDQTRKTNRK